MTQGDASERVREAARQWADHGWDGGSRLLASIALLRAEAAVRNSGSRVLKPHGLSYPRHELLILLYFSRRGEISMTRLSTLMMIHPTSVTSAVTGLVRLELVERAAEPGDRRVTLARITESGRTAIERSTPDLLEHQFGLGALSEREATSLFCLLSKVMDHG